MYISVYKLSHNKYYIYKSLSPIINIESIINSDNNLWMQLHPLLYLIEQFPEDDMNTVDKITFMYMRKYGIMNVRGGSMRAIHLSVNQIHTILKAIGFNIQTNAKENKLRSNVGYKNIYFDDLVIPDNDENPEDTQIIENDSTINKSLFISGLYSKSLVGADKKPSESTLYDNCILCGDSSHNTLKCFYIEECRKETIKMEEICNCNNTSDFYKYYENDIGIHKKKDCPYYSSFNISSGKDNNVNYYEIFKC